MQKTFDELVNDALRDIFDGLIIGGCAVMRNRIYSWMSYAILWRQEQDKLNKKS